MSKLTLSVSIQKIIRQAIQSIRENFRFFLGITLLFFILSALLEGTLLWIDKSNIFVFYLLAFIGVAFYVKQAVVIHRSVILDEVDRWDQVFSWGSPENQFLLVTIGLWLLFSLFIGVITAIMIPFINGGFNSLGVERTTYLILIPMMLIGGVIFARICLIFPSRAINKRMRIEQSFALTKGNTFKVFLLIVLLPLASNLLVSELLSEDTLIYNLFVSLIAHLIVVFQVSVLSHTYIALTEQVEADKQTSLNL